MRPWEIRSSVGKMKHNFLKKNMTREERGQLNTEGPRPSIPRFGKRGPCPIYGYPKIETDQWPECLVPMGTFNAKSYG